MTLHLRRVQENSGLGNVFWVLFEEGNIYRPLALLDPHQMEILVEEYEQQEDEAAAYDPKDEN